MDQTNPRRRVGNLDPPRTHFVGRDDELDRLERLLESHRLVTITGPGGAGKTRLSREFGRRTENFPAGVWFVDLSSATTEDDIALSVGRALGIPVETSSSHTALNRIGDAFVGRSSASHRALTADPRDTGDLLSPTQHKSLVILDNLEQVLQPAVAAIETWLGEARHLHVIATSRQPLNLRGEGRLALGPLPRDAAIELFEERVASVHGLSESSEFPREEITELVDRLDRLPLAIELAASRTHLMTVSELLERLEDSFELLRSRDPSSPDRHVTLEATIEWSWSLLDDAERALLMQCTVFRGGFTLAAVEGVVQLEEGADPVPDILHSLADKSLLEVERGDGAGRVRFDFYAAVREFIERRRDGDLPDDLVARHADCFARLLEHWSGSDIPGARQELDNVFAAFERCIEHDPLRAVRVIVAASEMLRLTGAPERLFAAVDEAIRRLGALDDALLARLHLVRAHCLAGRRDHVRAQRDFDRALELAVRSGDDSIECDVRSDRALTLHRRGKIDEAIADLEKAVEMASHLADPRRSIRAEGNQALLEARLGDLARARHRLQRCVENSIGTDNADLEARGRTHLGEIELMRGDLEAAREQLEAALRGHRETEDQSYVWSTLSLLADVHARCGQPMLGLAHLREALEHARSIGDRRREALALLEFGSLDDVELERSTRDYLTSALAILEEEGSDDDVCLAASALVLHDLREGHYPSAEAAVEDTQRRLDGEEGMRGAWGAVFAGLRAIAFAGMGRKLMARRSLEKCRDRVRALGHPEEEIQLYEALVDHFLDVESTSDLATLVGPIEAAMTSPGELPRWRPASFYDVRLDLLDFLKESIGMDDGSEVDSDAEPLRIRRDGRHFIPPGGEEQDFSRRGPMRRILVRLAEARIENPGVGLDLGDLMDAGWPDEAMTYESGQRRVYTTISNLRSFGLDDVLLTTDDGYLIDPSLPVEWLED